LDFVSLSVRRFRFGLNERFGANYYRLNAFGYSALFLLLFVDCLYSATLLCFYSSTTARICLLCLHFVSLSVCRIRFGLNGGFGVSSWLLAFGTSALFLLIDCIYLLCLHFLSLSVSASASD
jgi:hypothetical protein